MSHQYQIALIKVHDAIVLITYRFLSRQLEKLVTAISAIDADLLGMLELENDFGAAEGDDCTLKSLVDAVNQC